MKYIFMTNGYLGINRKEVTVYKGCIVEIKPIQHPIIIGRVHDINEEYIVLDISDKYMSKFERFKIEDICDVKSQNSL